MRLRLYSAHPFPGRRNRVPDPFAKDALAYLTATPDGTFVRMDTVDNPRVVRVGATVYALLGDAKASLDWLEAGISKRAMYPLQLRDPQLTLVQREPRYQELLRRLAMTGGT